MRPGLRQAEMAALVERRGRIGVEELARRFAVSQETVRRDLAALDEAGALQKVHGGAKRLKAEEAGEGSFAERMARNAAAKRAIAVKAAGLLQRGQTLFVDTGSTTAMLARELAKVAGLTVITNSSRVAEAVAGSEGGSQVFLLGGHFDADNRETLGPTAIAQIADYHADLAVLTVAALDADHGAMDFSYQEAEVARAMMQHAEALMVLADSSKFGRRAAHRLCELARIDVVVSECEPPPTLRKSLSAAGVAMQ